MITHEGSKADGHDMQSGLPIGSECKYVRNKLPPGTTDQPWQGAYTAGGGTMQRMVTREVGPMIYSVLPTYMTEAKTLVCPVTLHWRYTARARKVGQHLIHDSFPTAEGVLS